MNYLKSYCRLLVYFTSFTVCSGDIKKSKKSSEDEKTNKLKMTSQLVIFRAFFSLFLSPGPDI